MKTWRDRLRPIISRVLAETAGQPERDINRALRQAWEECLLGERRNWPYTVFRSECRRQRGLEPTRKRHQEPAQPTLF